MDRLGSRPGKRRGLDARSLNTLKCLSSLDVTNKASVKQEKEPTSIPLTASFGSTMKVFSAALFFSATVHFSHAQCQCYQGNSYVVSDWTNQMGEYENILDYPGKCGFFKICNDDIVQVILRGETSYFAIHSQCDGMICAIDEYEIDNEQGLVHGGNAKIVNLYPDRGFIRGKFIAHPDGQDPHPGRETFYASGQFYVYQADPVECPASGRRGCD